MIFKCDLAILTNSQPLTRRFASREPDIDEIAENAVVRIDGNGRGALGKVDEKLPEEMKKVLDEREFDSGFLKEIAFKGR